MGGLWLVCRSRDHNQLQGEQQTHSVEVATTATTTRNTATTRTTTTKRPALWPLGESATRRRGSCGLDLQRTGTLTGTHGAHLGH